MTPLNEVQIERVARFVLQAATDVDGHRYIGIRTSLRIARALAPALELPEATERRGFVGTAADPGHVYYIVGANYWSAHSAAVKAIVGEPE